MTHPKKPETFDPNSVRKVMNVNAPPEVAWQVFTAKMGSWWPLAMYKIGVAKAIDVVIEPKVGGRWYELGEDGSTCDWGHVRLWEPQVRLILTWDIDADWQYDPALNTEIEVRFIPDGKNATRIELEHSHFDRYGPRRDEMRAIFDSQGNWGKVLAMFASVAEAEGKPR